MRWFSWAEPDCSESCARSCGTRSSCTQFSSDTDGKKTTYQRKSQALGLMLCFHGDADADGYFLEDEDEWGMGLCTCWSKIFSRNEEERHHAHEFVRWNDGHKKPHQDPMGFHVVSTCAGGLGSQFLMHACVFLRVVPGHFGALSNPCLPMLTTMVSWLNRRIVDTLCNCEWLAWAHHKLHAQKCISTTQNDW